MHNRGTYHVIAQRRDDEQTSEVETAHEADQLADRCQSVSTVHRVTIEHSVRGEVTEIECGASVERVE